MILAPQKGRTAGGDVSLPITQCVHDITDGLDGGAQSSESVHQTVGHASLACPGVDGGALLTGPHVSHTGLVPQVTDLRLVTPGRTILQISGSEPS